MKEPSVEDVSVLVTLILGTLIAWVLIKHCI